MEYGEKGRPKKNILRERFNKIYLMSVKRASSIQNQWNHQSLALRSIAIYHVHIKLT